ncbi:MAG TPA: DciA family protein [Burkholderiales bacterium]|nr:DciA family protein [Burkholderiales bacterium]
MTGDRIGVLLQRLPELQALSRKAGRLSALRALLAQSLPANLADATAAAVTETGELLLFADNGAVAAKLKQLTPRIMVFFRQRGVEVTGIRVQVQVGLRSKPLPQKQIFMGTGGGEAIDKLAGKIQDPGLRSALQRLARRARRSDHED